MNNQKDQLEFYNSRSPEYLEYTKNIPYSKVLVEKMVMSLGLQQSNKENILEVGAGQGRFSFELARHVRTLTSTDFSDHEVRLLAKHIITLHAKNIIPLTQDLLNPCQKLKGKTFDHIVGFFVLHHIPRDQYFKVIKLLLPLLKKGGRMSFIEPNNLYPLHAVEMIIKKDMEWEIEKQIYTDYIGKWKNACVKTGLTVVHWQKFGFFPPPFINVMPGLMAIEHVMESLPVLNKYITPFMLMTVGKV
jgi:cyclopropane fatty-acyl-phospholipid synthase-like methyltransferase